MPIKSRLGRNIGLAVIAVPMLMYGASTFDAGGGDQTVLRVGDRTVSRAMFDVAVANAAEAYGPSAADNPEVMQLISQDILQSFARRFLALERMDELGIGTVNGELLEAVQNDERFQDGGVYSPELFSSQVPDRPAYLEQLKDDLRWRKMDAVFESAEVVPGSLAEQIASFRSEIRIVRVLEVPLDHSLVTTEITEEVMQAHFEQNPDAYIEPPKVRFEYVVLDPADYEDRVVIDEEELRLAQQERVERAQANEERHLGIMVLETEQQANELLGLIAGGASFEELAMENSLDAGSRGVGGDIGFLAREDLDAAHANEVFEAEVGGVAGPFEADGTYLLYKVRGLIGGSVESFEESRDLLIDRSRREQIDLIVDEIVFDFETAALETSDTLSSAAGVVGLGIEQSDWITITQELGDQPAPFDDADVWSVLGQPQFLLGNENSPMVRRTDGRYVAARVLELQELRRLTFEEARDDIRDLLQLQAALSATAEVVTDGIERARAGEVVVELPFAEQEAVEVSLSGELPESLTEQQRTLLYEPDAWDESTLPAYTSQFDPDREVLFVYRLEEILEGEVDEVQVQDIEQSQALVSSTLLKLGYLNELDDFYNIVVYDLAQPGGAG